MMPRFLGVQATALALLFSCSQSSHWTNDQVYSEQREHRSSKLCYHSKDPVHGIDLEFVQTQEQLKVYLNVHSIPIPPHQGDPKSAAVKLKCGSEQKSLIAYRLEGGQRFLLPDNAAKMLIDSLKEGQDVSISLHGYRSTIKAEDFSKKFDRLQHPSPVENPFRLPL